MNEVLGLLVGVAVIGGLAVLVALRKQASNRRSLAVAPRADRSPWQPIETPTPTPTAEQFRREMPRLTPAPIPASAPNANPTPDPFRREMPALTSTPARSISLTMPLLADLSTSLEQLGGTPGTATESQLWAVSTLEMGDFPNLSFEQASALLSARRYSEGILHAEIGVMNRYENERWIEATLVDFIIRDPALRKRVIAWNNRSFARGYVDVPRPKKDEHYAKVQGFLRELLRVRH